MADERFEDKTLAKKDEAKMKGAEEAEAEAKAAPADKEKATPAAQKVKADAPKADAKPANTKATKEDKKDDAPKKVERKFVLERKYVVNLSAAYGKPKYKRADRAVDLLKDFCLRHMKAQDVKVEVELNNAIRKSARPVKSVSVLLKKDEAGTVFAALA